MPGEPTPYDPGRIELGEDRKSLIRKLADPNYLPSYDEIETAFTSTSDFTKFCSNSGRFERKPSELGWVHEFLNQEYIDALGQYLAQRIEELGGKSDAPIRIIEIGAGDGRLSHFLRQKLNELIPGKFQIVATDLHTQQISTPFPVQSIDDRQAIYRYQPEIVLVSWPPDDTDLTEPIRTSVTVKEYLVIAPPDGDLSGKTWDTWGISYPGYEHDREVPPYQAAGFVKNQLDELSQKQISRDDQLAAHGFTWESKPKDWKRSITTSFRRI